MCADLRKEIRGVRIEAQNLSREIIIEDRLSRRQQPPSSLPIRQQSEAMKNLPSRHGSHE